MLGELCPLLYGGGHAPYHRETADKYLEDNKLHQKARTSSGAISSIPGNQVFEYERCSHLIVGLQSERFPAGVRVQLDSFNLTRKNNALYVNS